jgi:hypothetical protein
MPLHPKTCSGLYSISCLLDALDGYAARRFEQSTRFGAVLDMVTDRCTTSCLLVFLASAWPRWALAFQGLISLDFASHYLHMFATLSMGGSDQSHKKVDASRSKILNLYYTNKVCEPLFFKCTWMLIISRLYCLSAAPSMKLSSLRYTFYPSPPPTSPPPSSKSRGTATRPQPSNPEVLPVQYHHSFSPIHTALRHWNWHAQTRWTRSCHGSLLVSVSQLWRSSNLSTSYNWSRLADGWPRETSKPGKLRACQESRAQRRDRDDQDIDGEFGHGGLILWAMPNGARMHID